MGARRPAVEVIAGPGSGVHTERAGGRRLDMYIGIGVGTLVLILILVALLA
jgi:hypothetical protein